MPICSKHNIEKKQKYNSTIFYCTKCESEKRIEHNQKLLSESNLAIKNKRSIFKTCKYTSKTESGLKRKKTPKQKARDLADLWFSRYIRIKYHFKIIDGQVYCQCIVNPSVIKLAQHMDNGHYESRGNEITRFYEDNCRPQNRSSNRFSGEKDHRKFGENLKKQIGEERFEKIHEMVTSNEIIHISEQYYKDIATKYRKLTNQLVEELGVTKWW